ncbi:MAG: hypothetical protein M1820_005756 [Bogoriella megaspora]|nr:MAG: hypothetical protein M1820_005756 [Bogoriella megaspora]
MSESPKSEEAASQSEPPKSQQWAEFYKAVDRLKIGLLGTYRQGVGPVSRAMVPWRNGPDFMFIANINSQKFKDLEASKECQITFQDSSTQDWICISGIATTADNKDPRIKELYTPGLKAWFADLGDGIHTGGADDPRMALIELHAKYITYWKVTVGSFGFMKEITQATMTGKVAKTGIMRTFEEEDIEAERCSS